MTIDRPRIEDAVRAILLACGQDTTREGLRDTPARYGRFVEEWLSTPDFTFTTFDAEGASEMVVQSGIQFYSLCEHHLLPFHGHATVAYIPNQRIVGLSKLARAVEQCARGFQNQERITRQVAGMIEDKLQPRGVAVLLTAEHLCMSMRGIRAGGALTTTCDLRGAFFHDPRTRAEFIALAGKGGAQ